MNNRSANNWDFYNAEVICERWTGDKWNVYKIKLLSLRLKIRFINWLARTKASKSRIAFIRHFI